MANVNSLVSGLARITVTDLETAFRRLDDLQRVMREINDELTTLAQFGPTLLNMLLGEYDCTFYAGIKESADRLDRLLQEFAEVNNIAQDMVGPPTSQYHPPTSDAAGRFVEVLASHDTNRRRGAGGFALVAERLLYVHDSIKHEGLRLVNIQHDRSLSDGSRRCR